MVYLNFHFLTHSLYSTCFLSFVVSNDSGAHSMCMSVYVHTKNSMTYCTGDLVPCFHSITV